MSAIKIQGSGFKAAFPWGSSFFYLYRQNATFFDMRGNKIILTQNSQ